MRTLSILNAKANESSGGTLVGVTKMSGVAGVTAAGDTNGSSSWLTVANSSLACSREAANPWVKDRARRAVMNLDGMMTTGLAAETSSLVAVIEDNRRRPEHVEGGTI